MARPQLFTYEQRQWVQERANTITDKELLQEWNQKYDHKMTFAAIRKLRQRLGIKKTTLKTEIKQEQTE
jgi:transposase